MELNICNEVSFKGNRLIKLEKVDRRLLLYFDNDEVYKLSDIFKSEEKIQIKCSKCNRIDYINLYNKRLITEPRICQTCNKIGELNPFYGKKHTEELKKQRSLERKGKWCIGENNGFYGKKHSEELKQKLSKLNKNKKVSEETKQKISDYYKLHPDQKLLQIQKSIQTKENWTEEQKQKFKDNIINGALKAKLSPNYYENKRKAAKKSNASQHKYKRNNFEKRVEQWLIDHNIEYNYSAIMSNNVRNMQFDFIIRHKRILIECQGTYWHADPRFFKDENLREHQKEKRISDEEKREFAKSHNFKLIEVWEYDIMHNNDFSKLEEILNENSIC